MESLPLCKTPSSSQGTLQVPVPAAGLTGSSSAFLYQQGQTLPDVKAREGEDICKESRNICKVFLKIFKVSNENSVLQS